MALPDFVRVRAENGSHISIPRAIADSAGLKPLKQSALGRDGRPLPPKHRAFERGSAATTTTNEADASESKED